MIWFPWEKIPPKFRFYFCQNIKNILSNVKIKIQNYQIKKPPTYKQVEGFEIDLYLDCFNTYHPYRHRREALEALISLSQVFQR